jgi:transposase
LQGSEIWKNFCGLLSKTKKLFKNKDVGDDSQMPKKIIYTLTTEELASIEQAIKNHTDLRVRERARIIRLLHLGKKPDEIGHLLSIQQGQAYYWHKRWREEGLEGLTDKPRSGRPKAAGEGYRQLLAKIIETDPQELGYAFVVWDAKRLMSHLEKETGVQVTEPTLLNILAEEGYVYRRPKHTLDPLQDEAVKEKAEETLELLKKKRNEPKSNFSLWTKQP